MGCKCCRWPVNACRMARMVRLLPLSFGGLVLYLTVNCFYNDCLITGAVLLVLFLQPLLPAKSLKLPPGPAGLPVLGYLPYLEPRPHQHLATLARKYGPLLHIPLGSIPGIVVTSARLAKEVLRTQDQVFSSRPESFVTWAKDFAYYNKDSGAMPGPFLCTMRRLVAVELLSPKRLEFFQSIRSEEMDAMVQELLQEVKGGKQVVDLNRTIAAVTMNVITRMVIQKRYYGKDISAETREEGCEFQKLLVAGLTRAGHLCLQDFIPRLRPVMSLLSSHERDMAKLAKRTDEFFDAIVTEHRQRQQNTTVESSRQDFVDVMLQSVGDDGQRLHDQAIKAVTMEMFMAGTETTALTIEWALAELLHHPAIQQKLQAELDAVIGTARLAQEADLPQLQYLHAVVRETFRLHPAAPLLMPPSNSHATLLDGYHIPAHSHVVVNVWAIGRDPLVWHLPDLFHPERFCSDPAAGPCHTDPNNCCSTGEVDQIDYMGLDFELLPFGSGRRNCPGMQSGALMVKLAVARLVHGFRWSLANVVAPEDMDMEEALGLNLQLQLPLYRVCCKARLPLEAYR